MFKDYKRDWLKERHQRKFWQEKYKELEATIKGEAPPLKMSDYDEAMEKLHVARDEHMERIKQLEAELKACQEACEEKDKEIAALKESIAELLKPGDLERAVAMELPVEAKKIPAPPNLDGAESKEDEDTSDGTSSGTSDEEEESYVDNNLRF
jgi:chromosome segregation ATPase